MRKKLNGLLTETKMWPASSAVIVTCKSSFGAKLKRVTHGKAEVGVFALIISESEQL